MAYVAVILVGSLSLYAAVLTIRKNGLGATWRSYKNLVWYDFFLSVPLVALTFAVIIGLYELADVFKIGWWMLLGGRGNALFAMHDDVSLFGNGLILLVLAVAVMLSMPPTIIREEEAFRKGAQNWSWKQRLWKAFGFGMIHMIMGVPLAAGIGLMVPGLAYTLVYLWEYRRRERDTPESLEDIRETRAEHYAVMRSTKFHLAYNTIVLSILLVCAVVLVTG